MSQKKYVKGNQKQKMPEQELASDVTRCPYNRSHVVQQSRLLWHIQKCKSGDAVKNLFGHCKYNYLHIFEKQHLSSHENFECPDRPKEIRNKDDINGEQAIHDEAFKKWKREQNKLAKNKNKANQNYQIEEVKEEDLDYEKHSRLQVEEQQQKQNILNVSNFTQINDISVNDSVNQSNNDVNHSWLEKNNKRNDQKNNPNQESYLHKIQSASEISNSESSNSPSSSENEMDNENNDKEPDVSFDKIKNPHSSDKRGKEKSNQKKKDRKSSDSENNCSDEDDEKDKNERSNQDDECDGEDNNEQNNELSFQKHQPQQRFQNNKNSLKKQQNTDSERESSSDDSEDDEDDDEDSDADKQEKDCDSDNNSNNEEDKNKMKKNKNENSLIENSLDASYQFQVSKQKQIIKSNRNEIESIKSANKMNQSKKKKVNHSASSSDFNSSDDDDDDDASNQKKNKGMQSFLRDQSQINDKNEQEEQKSQMIDQNISISMNNDEFSQSFIDKQKKTSKYQKRYVQLHNLPEDQRNNLESLQAELDQSINSSKKAVVQLSRGNRGNKSDDNESFDKGIKFNPNNIKNTIKNDNYTDSRQNQRNKNNNPLKNNTNTDESYSRNNNNNNNNNNRGNRGNRN